MDKDLIASRDRFLMNRNADLGLSVNSAKNYLWDLAEYFNENRITLSQFTAGINEIMKWNKGQ